ncbi:hypothetical protein pb186bvf_018669 [Paramecium bursaria]
MQKIIRHCFSTLVFADHHNGKVSKSTLKVLTAAQQLSKPITLLIVSDQPENVVKDASKYQEYVQKIIYIKHPAFKVPQADTLSQAIDQVINKYNFTTILTSTHSTAKDFLPRIAIKYDSQPITDVIQIKDNVFIRPTYAGNAVTQVQSNDKIKFISVRPTNFDEIQLKSGQPIEAIELKVDLKEQIQFISEQKVEGDKPELSSAKFVVSGGRGLQSRENFQILDKLAEALGNTAIGASRAAVDAGYANNDQQVGQTGKVVAPELYVAVGISGAIQHIAGMKDSKVIVAINKGNFLYDIQMPKPQLLVLPIIPWLEIYSKQYLS